MLCPLLCYNVQQFGYLPSLFYYVCWFWALQLAENFWMPTVSVYCRRQLSNSKSKSWAYLYSGHKGTMKRLLTAALCQLAAVAGSSKRKLRTDTINKGYEKQSVHLFYICMCMCNSMFEHSMLVPSPALQSKNSLGNAHLTFHCVWAEFSQSKCGMRWKGWKKTGYYRIRNISKYIN